MVDDATATMIANLPERTGRSLEAWLALLAGSGLERHGQIVAHLKSEHGMTHGYANLVAQRYLQGDQPSEGADLVDAQYEDAKASLRPIYDRIVALAQGLGKDVEIAPKKTSVSLRRSKQFALVTAATRTRVDLGLNLPGEPAAGRLQTATGMCTHRVALSTPEEVDAVVEELLRRAYERA